MNPTVFDHSHGQELRINMISSWLKRNYMCLGIHEPAKIIKLSVDGGFTCPNRDGTKGKGGCLFCSESGSGDMASKIGGDRDSIRTHVKNALEEQMELLERKWPRSKYNIKYIAYFQSHTNTYGPADYLRELFEAAIAHPDVVGLAVATRSDSISQEALDLLEELNRKTFLWVELGLQTCHDHTAKEMNLCHNRKDYLDALRRLNHRNIRVVTHLILGLPGESRQMMMDSVRFVCKEGKVFGIKLHMLNLVRGSAMEKTHPGYTSFETMEEYIETLIQAISIIPEDVTIHRISGDAPRNILISPSWSYQKRTILNNIHKTIREKNLWQGCQSEQTR